MRRACLEPHCPALVEPPASRCPTHQAAYDRERAVVRGAYERDRARARGTAAARGYTSAWREARARYLAAHPYCEPCRAAGRPTVRAVLVDHHVPLRSGGPRLDPSNFTAMCASCHGLKTWRERRASHAK